jgi:hypothetical protein
MPNATVERGSKGPKSNLGPETGYSDEDLSQFPLIFFK